MGNGCTETSMQLSAGAGGFVNANLHHTLALGEVASPDVGWNTDSVPVAALVALDKRYVPVGSGLAGYN
jgi:hypothetical protein